MSKSQFSILMAAVIVLVAIVGYGVLKPDDIAPPVVIVPSGDNCFVCGRDKVAAHGSILVKNTTPYEVSIIIRHHPEAQPKTISLDPKGIEMVDWVLVGNLQLRAVGDGFNEETYCAIMPNQKHEMWWTTTGWEMHGASQMHGAAPMRM